MAKYPVHIYPGEHSILTRACHAYNMLPQALLDRVKTAAFFNVQTIRVSASECAWLTYALHAYCRNLSNGKTVDRARMVRDRFDRAELAIHSKE